MSLPDIVIVGGGMAGASLGAELAGYHATARSVAFWEETYGGPAVQPLTTSSGPMLAAPDPDFHDGSFLSPRRTLHIGRASDEAALDALIADFAGRVDLQPVDPAAYVPGLRSDWMLGVMEASCRDIDVAALHQAWLRQLRRRGGTMQLGARLISARCEGSGLPSPDLPLVMDLGGGFYFKPEGRDRVWLTPHDEVPSPPCDAAPEEMAVAQAVARFEAVVDWPVAGIEHRWAGLRSFAPDRAPVYGFDPDMPGFFWFAGQGGFGIQTAPAAATLAASLIRGVAPPAHLAPIDAATYDPARFRSSIARLVL